MSPKNLVLVAAAVAVLVMGVYLFIQVRATPAQAGHVTAPPPPPTTRTATNEGDEAHTPPPADTQVQSKTPWRGGSGKVRLGNDVVEPTAVAASPPSDDQKVNVKLDNLMELANKAYDRQDFDEAIAIAGKILAKEPTNTRMLRIMVSASCIQGDSAVAQQHYEKLPPFDREQMKARCDRYGVTFKDP